MEVPVVCADADGLPRERRGCESPGSSVSRRDAGAITEALSPTGEQVRNSRRNMGASGRPRVLSHFRLTDQIAAFVALYDARPRAIIRVMTARVDLVWLGAASRAAAWPFGATYRAAAECARRARTHRRARRQIGRGRMALLGFRARSAHASRARCELLERPGDVWHAGLALGSGGRSADHRSHHAADLDIQPRSRRGGRSDELARIDPRLSRAHQRAAVERAITRIRFARRRRARVGPPVHHERRAAAPRAFVAQRARGWHESRAHADRRTPFRARALRRALVRMGRVARRDHRLRALRGHRGCLSLLAFPVPRAALAPYIPAERQARAPRPAVTVLIPTLDRYEYLRTILSQLRAQTVRPLEVIVVDQTPAARRAPPLEREFLISRFTPSSSSRQGSAPREMPVSHGRTARRSCSWMMMTRSHRISSSATWSISIDRAARSHPASPTNRVPERCPPPSGSRGPRMCSRPTTARAARSARAKRALRRRL